MGPLFYFALIAIQSTSILATHSIPLRCFLQSNNAHNLLGVSPIFGSPYGILTIDPLRFSTVRANSVAFDKDGWFHEAENVEYTGLDNSILDDFGFNMISNISHITFHTDLLVSYPYKTSGSLFSIPIQGEGFSKVFLKNVQFGLTMPFDIIEVNGNKFFDLKNFNYWSSVRDDADFSFSNLYYGNKEQSDAMHNIMKQNWKFITERFGTVFMDKVAENVFNVFRNYMLTMPLRNFETC